MRIDACGPRWNTSVGLQGDRGYKAMIGQRRVIYLSIGRGPTWLRVLVAIGALIVAAIAFWLGLFLAIAAVAAAALVLVPVLIWRALSASRRPSGPATIEGEYTVASSSAVDILDEPQQAEDRSPKQ